MDLQIIRTRHPPAPFIEQLALIHTEEGFSVTASEIRLRIENLFRSDRLLFALEGEKLLGYAHIHIPHDLLSEGTAELTSIFVRKSSRSQNVGRQLVNAAETWARESGCTRLVLRVDADANTASPFFTALGFQHTCTKLEFTRVLE